MSGPEPTTTDHPRVSGEHCGGNAGDGGGVGSSPRERGAHSLMPPGHYEVRIIPA